MAFTLGIFLRIKIYPHKFIRIGCFYATQDIHLSAAKRINISPEKIFVCRREAYQYKFLCEYIFIRRNIFSVNATLNSATFTCTCVFSNSQLVVIAAVVCTYFIVPLLHFVVCSFSAGVAPGIFRRGADSSDEGAKI